MKISQIAAISDNFVLGLNGKLPWNLPEDLQWFRDWTKGQTVVMGRKTFDSLGKPLPKRDNWVISRLKETKQLEEKFPNVKVFSEVSEVLDHAKAMRLQEIFVIGGGEIYSQFLPYSTRLILTRVQGAIDGDAFYPQWNPAEFREIYSKEGSETSAPYTFKIYSRR